MFLSSCFVHVYRKSVIHEKSLVGYDNTFIREKPSLASKHNNMTIKYALYNVFHLIKFVCFFSFLFLLLPDFFLVNTDIQCKML